MQLFISSLVCFSGSDIVQWMIKNLDIEDQGKVSCAESVSCVLVESVSLSHSACSEERENTRTLQAWPWSVSSVGLRRLSFSVSLLLLISAWNTVCYCFSISVMWSKIYKPAQRFYSITFFLYRVPTSQVFLMYLISIFLVLAYLFTWHELHCRTVLLN